MNLLIFITYLTEPAAPILQLENPEKRKLLLDIIRRPRNEARTASRKTGLWQTVSQ